MQKWISDRSSGTLGDRARANAKALAALPPMDWRQRVEHVQVMCAANTLAMILLVGIVVLQVRAVPASASLASVLRSAADAQVVALPVQISEWYMDESLLRDQLKDAQTPVAQPAPAAAPAKVTAERKKQ